MKRILRIVIRIALAVAAVLLLLYWVGFGRRVVGLWQVERVELTASNGAGTSTVELEKTDVRNLITRLNCSRYVGEVTADGCEQIFIVRIYLENGEYIAILDGVKGRAIVDPSDGERYWVDDAVLQVFVEELVSDYGLIWEDWGCC